MPLRSKRMHWRAILRHFDENLAAAFGSDRPIVGVRAKLTAYTLPALSHAGPSIWAVNELTSVNGVATNKTSALQISGRTIWMTRIRSKNAP